MDDLVYSNSLNDTDFEVLIFPKLISKIKEFHKFKELYKLVTEKGLRVVFRYFKEERKHEIFFEVGFDICDINGKTIAPTSDDPKEYYYDLGELISYPHGAHYSKKRKKLTIIEDNDELYEDCLDIIDYLKNAYNGCQ